eukprot:7378925-Prymnesium_polylepis.1
MASRMTLVYAESLVAMVLHLEAHGFDTIKVLKALVGKSPLVGKILELSALMLSPSAPAAILMTF